MNQNKDVMANHTLNKDGLMNNGSYEVASCENVIGVDCALQSLEDVYACFSNTPVHEFLPQLSHPVVMRYAPSEFHYLVPGCVLNLSVTFERISQPMDSETKVNVNHSSCVIDLNKLFNT